MEGWIKLHRRLIKHWIWNNDKYLKAWVYCLFRANHQSNTILIGSTLIELKPGEFITSIGNFSNDVNMTPQMVRTFWGLLEMDKMINKESTSKSTKITICNYDGYQHEQQDNNKPITNQQQTNNKPTTTDKNVKNVNNEKEVKTRVRKSLMRNNEGLFTKVKESFLKTQDLKNADALYYFNICLDWSDSKNEMRTDWVATVRGFARRDLKDGKMKVSPFVQVGGSNLSIKEPEPEPVKSNTAMTRAEWMETDDYKKKFNQ